jgi:hypothetical protein
MTFIFNKQKEEIVLDMPEPLRPGYSIKGNYLHDLNVYNNRPRYPVSKELSDSWEDGKKVVEGKDFKIVSIETCPYNCSDGEPDCSKKFGICTHIKTAVPPR